jgi:hypothetical protein
VSKPESERVRALVRRIEEGEATEAERVELALYTEENEEFAQEAEKERERMAGNFLVRIEKDQELVAREKSPRVRAERSFGLGLAASGITASFFSPVGPLLTAVGLSILVWSAIRLRLQNAVDDPYKDIEQ